MKRYIRLLPISIVFLVALFVIWPLLGSGFIPTHDGEYHLIRFYEFDKNIRSGIFFPRWAPDLNYGYGVPLFNFFYPLPNYWAELFHLLSLSFIDSFKMVMVTGVLFAGLFFFLWIKKLWGKKAAMVGAIFYILAPYFLVDVYVRGSVGEVLALALYPAVLWATEKKSILAPVFLAFLILAHNILALIFLPFFLTYLIIRKISRNYAMSIFFLGFGLACYFWLPALVEAKYVTGLKMINFVDHFPTLYQLLLSSWGTGFSVFGVGDSMSFQIGIPHLVVILAGLVFLRKEKFFKFFLVWFLLICFLLSEISLPIWKVVPFMSYFQYPWRWLSLLILISSSLAGLLVSLKIHKYFSIFLILLALVFYGSYARPVIYQPRADDFYLSNPNWTQGTASLGNSFNTIWFSAKPAGIKNQVKIKEISTTPIRRLFQVKTEAMTNFQTKIAYFPGWRVMVNNQEKPIDYKQGVIEFQLDKGNSLVEIKFTNTPIRVFANSISLLSLLFLSFLAIFKKRIF